MDLKGFMEKIETYDFPQRFLALILLVQASTILVGIVMRILFEIGIWPVSLILYLALIIFSVVIMMAGLSSLNAKTLSYVSAALLYFVAAIVIAFLLMQLSGGFFTIISVGGSIFATWSGTNLLVSVIILIIALVRLLALGAAKDYSRQQKTTVDADTTTNYKNEIERLKQELQKLKEEKQQSQL